jgi:hypothetical protein
MSDGSITQITLKANEEIIKRTRQKRRGNFYMVGKESYVNISEMGKKPEYQYEGIDFIDQVVAMSNNERTVMKLIKDDIRWDKAINSYGFIVKLPPESLAFDQTVDDSMLYSTFLKGFKLLHKKDLARRVRKGEYMFNPEFFILTGEQVPYFQRLWDESKPYKDNT